MKNFTLCLLIFFCCCAVPAFAQNAPVTTAGIVINATTVPGSVVVPVTVKNFTSIGSFTLTLRYKASLVSYAGAVTHPSFPGMTVVNTVAGTLGNIVITWPRTPGGITLPDETHLADLSFTYLSSTSPLTWLYTGSYVCQFEKYSSGSYITLNDVPKSSFYINGAISNRGAPVTHLPVITNAVAGNIAVPVTVDNFTSIGAMSLTLEYNQSVLTFQNCTPNPSLGGTFNAGTQVGPNGKMLLTISWFGLATMANGSTIVTANFVYATGAGNYSTLNWYETGSSCEYADVVANPLPDSPTSSYYQNGAVLSQYAPNVWLPVNTPALPNSGLSVPVIVSNFNNIRSFTLTFEYDPQVMSFSSYRPDAAFGSALSATDSPSGAKRKIVLAWTGVENKTLPDGSIPVMLYFTYGSGTSALSWIVSDAISCRFNDAAGQALFDLPKSSYYRDGLVASHPAPVISAANLSAEAGAKVTLPLTAFSYSNIGQFTLTLDYDPSVLTWLSATPEPSLGGIFTPVADGTGRILLNWTGPASSLADGATLVNLSFNYNGGSSPLAWSDDGNSCRFAEIQYGPALYDIPAALHYINGYVGPDPLTAGFVAAPLSGSTGTVFTLTDQTTGGPAAWYWTIDPSTFRFVNGTGATSQNPQVEFTADGLYTVTLVASRGAVSSRMCRIQYLTCGALAWWAGGTSSDWFSPANWQGGQVPVANSTVYIKSTAAHWPHLTGNLSLGTLCKNLSLDADASIYVDGNLSVAAGSSLGFSGSGTLYLGGNWSNSGIFSTGSGTIEFFGPNNASILGGTLPETFWKTNFAKSSATVTIDGTVNVIGIINNK